MVMGGNVVASFPLKCFTCINPPLKYTVESIWFRLSSRRRLYREFFISYETDAKFTSFFGWF